MDSDTTQQAARSRRVTLSRLPGFAPARLRALRTDRGLSVRDLADLIGCSVGSVRKWEAGQTAPDPRRARQLADAVDVPVRHLTELAETEIGLAELRALNGLTARDLSDRTGIDTATISYIETGHRQPNEAQAQVIATVLNIPIEQITELWHQTRARRLNEVRGRAHGTN